VFVVGWFSGTVDMDPGPNVRTITSVRSDNNDGFFAKYTSTGEFVWAFNLGSRDGTDIATTCVIDDKGFLNIGGSYSGDVDFNPRSAAFVLSSMSGSVDAFFARYDTYGDLVYAKSVGGVGVDAIHSIDAIEGQFLVVSGSFEHTADLDPDANEHLVSVIGAGTDNNLFFGLYSPDLEYIWARTLPMTAGHSSIAFDAVGNIYLAGSYTKAIDMNPAEGEWMLPPCAGNTDCYVGKYNSDGELIYTYGFGGMQHDAINTVLIDGEYVYLSGYFGGVMDIDPSDAIAQLTAVWSQDVFIAQFTSTSFYRWAFNLASDVMQDDGRHLTIDSNDILTYAGGFYGTVDFDPGPGVANVVSQGNADICIAKYTNVGQYLSAFGVGYEFTNENARSIAMDYNGSTVAIGNFWNSADFDPGPNEAILTASSPSGTDGFMAKYTTDFVGVGEDVFHESNTRLFPNPASDVVTITAETQIDRIVVHDVVGNVVHHMDVKGATQVTINTTMMSVGTYSVCVYSTASSTNVEVLPVLVLHP